MGQGQQGVSIKDKRGRSRPKKVGKGTMEKRTRQKDLGRENKGEERKTTTKRKPKD